MFKDLRIVLAPLASGLILGLFTPFAQAQSTTTIVGTPGNLQFKLTYSPTIDLLALNGFEEAAGRWSSLFDNPVTINLNIGFSDLGSSTIGQTNVSEDTTSYTQVRTDLAKNAQTVDALAAVTSLPTGSTFTRLINHATDTSHPTDSSTPFVETGNGLVRLTKANAKVLGISESGTDATITFNSAFTFDFNPDDGITAGAYDFVGAATHEIGHAMGFFSNVDSLNTNPGQLDTNTSNQSTVLDLFRYSAQSVSDSTPGNPVMDFTADTGDKYFSINDGAGDIASFSTGSVFGAVDPSTGQRYQASHWIHVASGQTPVGIMDPAATTGQLLQISQTDIRAFNVIGYDLAPAPEPSENLVLFLGIVGIFGLIVRRHSYI